MESPHFSPTIKLPCIFGLCCSEIWLQHSAGIVQTNIIYCIYWRFHQMSHPPPEQHSQEPLLPQGRRLGVIVLTDNRPSLPAERNLQKDFRGSAFKETEVDPLQFPRGQNASLMQLDLFAELSRRVAQLEERVQALQEAEDAREHLPQQKETASRRNRRKFGDLVREYQCTTCQRRYGSETALKNHNKIKHGRGAPEHSDDS